MDKSADEKRILVTKVEQMMIGNARYLIIGLLALGLAACQEGGQKQSLGTLLGAVAGAVAGAQVGKGRGRLAAVAGGALLGSLLGGNIGKSLDNADRIAMQQTTQRTLRDFQQLHPGKMILPCDVWNRLLAAERTLRVHPHVHEWMGEGDPESSAFWEDPQTGIRCKGRLDWYNPGLDMIMDLKFTDCVKYSLCLRRIERHHYDLQAAWYCRAVKALRGSQPVFAIIYIETVKPHRITPIVLSPADLERGEQKIHAALYSLPDAAMTDHAFN